MTIAPIVRTVTVKAPPARAFELFVGAMGEWWPRGKTIGHNPFTEIVVERRPGGRWFERAGDGVETDWGKVLEISPPHRLLLAWQLDAAFRHDPTLITEVELTFAPLEGGTRVTLEHRNLERFGDSAARLADQLGGGWPTILDLFAGHADGET
jgi:uncharacterized protein YndB with AHSA1/START domain